MLADTSLFIRCVMCGQGLANCGPWARSSHQLDRVLLDHSQTNLCLLLSCSNSEVRQLSQRPYEHKPKLLTSDLLQKSSSLWIKPKLIHLTLYRKGPVSGLKLAGFQNVVCLLVFFYFAPSIPSTKGINLFHRNKSLCALCACL